jgi:hypothetical protein
LKYFGENKMTKNNLLIDLQSEIWDFYKDVHGIRPRHFTQENWDSFEFLQEQREKLCKAVANASHETREIEIGW